MLSTVSGKLGISPEKLKEALKTGDISMALQNMPKKDAEKLKAILGNPEMMKKVMNSKQAQEIKKNFNN
ncbi:MAG: hypothetical protein E7490_01730 [Ruminococcaceae bacterium]|nr:hypothetical protein [Oscillospiraceae bacterium]